MTEPVIKFFTDALWTGLYAYIVYCIHSYSIKHLEIVKGPMCERREPDTKFPWARENSTTELVESGR